MPSNSIIQHIFNGNEQKFANFINSLSQPRFSAYMKHAQDNQELALLYYNWNTQLSQSVYLYLQSWEICLRNKLNDFLVWKYTADWPYNSKFTRQLSGHDSRRLDKTITKKTDNNTKPTTPAIVSDLSCGFWTSMLSKHYENPFVMRGNKGDNLFRVFPNITQNNTRNIIHASCERLTSLRNRVAHHEPIHYMPLNDLYVELQNTVQQMCSTTHAYSEAFCNFPQIYQNTPILMPQASEANNNDSSTCVA